MSESDASAPQRRRRGGSRQSKNSEGSTPASADPTKPVDPAAQAAPATENTDAPKPRRGRGRGRGPRRDRPASSGPRTPSAPAAPGEPVPTDVFLRNLPRQLTKEAIIDLVKGFGEQKKIRLIRRFGRLSAHLKFETPEIASKVVAGLEGSVVEERTIHANVYEDRPRRPRAAAAAGENADAGAGGAPTEGAPAQNRRGGRGRKPAAEGAAADGPEGQAASAGGRPKRNRRRQNTGDANPANALAVWVGNLPEDVTDEEIRAFFAGHGTITEVYLRPKFAYVTLDTPENVAGAIAALNGKKIKDAEIKVENRRGTRPPRKSREANADPLKVWVGNLPENFSVDELSKQFNNALKIDAHYSFAYLTFDNAESVQAALAKDQQPLIGGQPISVAPARF